MEWPGTVIGVLVTLIFGWIVWRTLQPTARFVIKFRQGHVTVKDTVTEAFLTHVLEVVQEFGIQHGSVRGLDANGKRIRLEMNREFPPEARQRLRNWWVLSGWRSG